MSLGRTILQRIPFNSKSNVVMTSLFRPLLSSLLCGVIAFGQAPALLHVACCHGEPEASACNAEVQAVVCSGGCQHAKQDHGVDPAGPKHAPAHDPDSCTICQSLLGPAGLVWVDESPLVIDCLYERATQGVDRNLYEAILCVPQPRSPPGVASVQTVS